MWSGKLDHCHHPETKLVPSENLGITWDWAGIPRLIPRHVLHKELRHQGMCGGMCEGIKSHILKPV